LLREKPSQLNAQITAHAKKSHSFPGFRILGLNKKTLVIINFEVFG